MDNKLFIPLEKCHFFNVVCIDEVGEVFEWKGKILRGITEEAKPLVDRYFTSGFLDYIVKKGMFPKTEISAYTNPKYCYILEHEKVELQTIDAEWSFDMLKDAALLVCEIAAVAWRYGFNMKDCHTKNVLFKDNKPIYVDLGSFVNIEEGISGFKSYDQILSYYYYVLRLWSDGCVSLPKQLQCLYRFEKRDYLLYKYPLYRHLGKVLNVKCELEEKLFLLTIVPFSTPAVQKSKITKLLWKLVNKYKIFNWQRTNTFVRRIDKIETPNSLKNKKQETRRFSLSKGNKALCEVGKNIVIVNPSCYDFLEATFDQYNDKNIITIDVDDRTGNTNYLKYKSSNYRITNLSFNLCYPLLHYNYQTPPCKRLKANTFIIVNPVDIVEGMRKPVVVLYKTLLDYDFDTMVVIEDKGTHYGEDEERAIAKWYVQQGEYEEGDFIVKRLKKNEDNKIN